MTPYRSLLLAIALLMAGPASSQTYDCSLAASEIDRDRCFSANAEARRNNDTSRQRIEQYSRQPGGSDQPAYVPTPQEAERLEYWRERTAKEKAEREKMEQRQHDAYDEQARIERQTEDTQQRVQLMRQSCDATPARECGRLARALYLGPGIGAAPSTEQAYAAALRGCNSEKSSEGCGVLGTLYLNGYAVDRSYAQALRYLRPACEAGDGLACSGLGQMYEQGQGVVRSPAAARRAYEKGCKADYDEACEQLKAMKG